MAPVHHLASATAPVRCPHCGQQTHKTLAEVRKHNGLACSCGALIKLDLAEFEREVRRSEAAIRDFGKQG